MPDNTINWGQAAVNNSNDWGKAKANSTNNFGAVYDSSPSGDTNIAGGLALSITYSASAYCDGIGDTPQPTVSGNTGSGTFSSTAGLTINSSTGVIDVDASTKGATYLVTYTDTDSDTATANITLNALDNAAFAYSASSYEPTDADPTPTITGLSGGTFSSTSGLVFVDSGTNTGSSTGEIDLSATTIASYTITYDTTSSGSSVCPNTSTQTVDIALAGISNVYSMSFDGSNDTIQATGSIITGNNLRSVSLWYKTTSSSAQIPFSIGNPDDTTSNSQFAYCLNREDNSEKAAIFGKSNDTSAFTVPNTSDGNWHHLVVTYDQSALKVYIDGNLEATPNLPSSNYATSSGLTIGSWSDNNRYFNGSIDEVAIWNTALTSTQVQSIYDATGTNLTKDLTTVSGSNLIYWNRMGD